MIAVIFESTPHPGLGDSYADLAAGLRPCLEQAAGFVSVERFESLTEPGKILSLSFWQDEESPRAWRNLPEHRAAQSAGRRRIFAGYRLRVGAIIRDYGLSDRDQAPSDSRVMHGGGADV